MHNLPMEVSTEGNSANIMFPHNNLFFHELIMPRKAHEKTFGNANKSEN